MRLRYLLLIVVSLSAGAGRPLPPLDIERRDTYLAVTGEVLKAIAETEGSEEYKLNAREGLFQKKLDDVVVSPAEIFAFLHLGHGKWEKEQGDAYFLANDQLLPKMKNAALESVKAGDGFADGVHFVTEATMEEIRKDVPMKQLLLKKADEIIQHMKDFYDPTPTPPPSSPPRRSPPAQDSRPSITEDEFNRNVDKFTDLLAGSKVFKRTR
uniref:Uncharacterized protein n=1 Tax=Chromera velia CCMP2878 TaxID=1169474 RepID=A0A0G4GVV4_9ALVE|eukprot:Cvel_23605.t1-p1 / transcript=Cvel_23605.t1 / gene=Cvel_23605 / organism=Chromera_velia_CCMP2878 / gene_product=hypothetical protein / transcript_product=hypothetical protein / location=Cvel_scaffold2451:14144-14773(-) / protein_length=210 / sequence_SO=supercontig / SO=protein_coding / is_pseudo=false